ncbi:MAG: class I SAM-dependent methyltransferase [Candidatus Geothermarchaeales archaeon]
MWWVLIVTICVIIALQVIARVAARVHPHPIPPVFYRLIDTPTRNLVMNGEKTLRRSGLRDGLHVLDLGCGTGFLTFEAARMVGGGIVYALDLQRQAVGAVNGKAKKRRVDNVMPVVADAQRLPLKDQGIDLAFLVATLGEIPNKEAALGELRRTLKAGGSISVTEVVFDPHYVLMGTTRRLAEGSGFDFTESRGSFLCYTANFRKA